MILWFLWFFEPTHALLTQYEFIVVNGQSTLSEFHKVVQQHYLSEVLKLQLFTSSFFVLLRAKNYQSWPMFYGVI